jgi:hypothetical protein
LSRPSRLIPLVQQPFCPFCPLSVLSASSILSLRFVSSILFTCPLVLFPCPLVLFTCPLVLIPDRPRRTSCPSRLICLSRLLSVWYSRVT